MSSTWQRRWRRLRFALIGLIATALILMAAGMALGQLLVPLAARYPERVAAMLSARLHRPVSFAALEGRWQLSGPLLIARDVELAGVNGGQSMRLPQVAFKLDLGALVVPTRSWLNLRLSGVKLQLRRDVDGVWHVAGFGTNGSQSTSLEGISADLWISDLDLSILDGRTGTNYELRSPQAHIRKQGNQVRFAGSMQRLGVAGVLEAVGLFAEDGSYGRVFVGGQALNLGAMAGDLDIDGYGLANGKGEVRSWLDWRHGQVVRSVSKVDLDDLTVHGPMQSVSVPALHGLLDLQRRGDGDHLLWAADDGGVLTLQHARDAAGAADLQVAVRELELAPLVPWAALLPDLPADVARWLGGGHPRGRLASATLHWSANLDDRQVEASFKGLGIDAVGNLPGIERLDGDLRGDATAFSLQLPTQATTVRLPEVFRQPLVFASLGGDISAWHDEGAWHVGLEPFDFRGEGYGGQLRGEMALPDDGSRPVLDIYAALGAGDVPAAKLFWPIHSMSEGTIHWLDRGLVAGRIEKADALVHGSLADWPFREQQGRFEGRAQLADLTLDYGTGWPAAEHVAAVASFVNNGMLVDASGAQAREVKTDKAVATIDDFADAQLLIEASGGGSASGLLDFVRNSPVGRNSTDVLDKLKLGGDARFGFRLAMPLKHVEGFTLQGTAQLQNADLAADAWNLNLTGLTGPLVFDGKGMRAGPLTTAYRGRPASLTLAVAGATDDPAKLVDADLRGDFSLAELVAGYDSLAWLGDLGKGRATFDIGFDAIRGDGGKSVQTLHVKSDLDGMELTLPKPVKKPANGALALAVNVGLPVEGAPLDIALGDVVRARMRLPNGPDKPLAAAFNLGTAMPTALPAKGMQFSGHGDEVDLSGWVQYAAGSASGGQGPGLAGIDISTDHGALFGQNFGALHLVAKPAADELLFTVDSVNLAGDFHVPSSDLNRRGMTARLQRLYWPRDDASAGGAAKGKSPPAVAASAPPAGGTAPSPQAAASMSGIAPASLPPLHLWIGDLRLGDAHLGEARLETWPTDKGMHIDQLRAQSKNIQVTASGDWNGDARVSQTHLSMDFGAENLGRMLDALGFAGLFEGGKTQARLDATWPGGPSTLSLANMNGHLRVDVSKGRIPEVQPGVGRLFGLVSLAELPRRLSFDFGDVLGKGLSFDAISGDFRLADGNATTDNVQIRGPAAEITITGRTGLRARDYDQQVLVLPHVGNSLPVVGALAAGPVGAAAGFAVQGLLGKGLSKAASARYTVTGSWDKPVFTLVEKKNLTVPAPVNPPTTGNVPAPASR